MKSTETELSSIPSPNSTMNQPRSIGFLVRELSPVVTSFLGGLIGTGEPLALAKLQTVSKLKVEPITSSGTDRKRLAGNEKGRCSGRSLSSHNEAKIKTTIKLNQRIIPNGVIMIFSLFLVVTIRYINSADLSAKPMVLLFNAGQVQCSSAWVCRQALD